MVNYQLGLRQPLRLGQHHEIGLHDAHHLGARIALDACQGEHGKRDDRKHRRDNGMGRIEYDGEKLCLVAQEVGKRQREDE